MKTSVSGTGEIVLLSSSLLGTWPHVADDSSPSRLCWTWFHVAGSFGRSQPGRPENCNQMESPVRVRQVPADRKNPDLVPASPHHGNRSQDRKLQNLLHLLHTAKGGIEKVDKECIADSQDEAQHSGQS